MREANGDSPAVRPVLDGPNRVEREEEGLYKRSASQEREFTTVSRDSVHITAS